MYHFPGEYVTDFCIVRRDGVYHLFHIRGERWSWPFGYKEIDLGHAVSWDLRVWQPRAAVVPAGEPGAWDEAGIWAPDIIEANGLYYMVYTGSDALNNQAIGLATSPDLESWTKHPANPVVTPGPWSDRQVGRDVAGRDAMVYHDAARGRYLLYYTATMAGGRACLAVAESTDLIRWHDLGPTYIEEDRSFNRLESAYLVAHGGRYYLFYSAKGGPKSKGFSPADFAHFDIVYQIADDPTGPWQKPANHVLLTEWSCASEHPTFDGVTYMLYIVQEELRDEQGGVWGASVLSDPKRIAWQADGTVRVVEHLPANVTRRTLFDSAEAGYAGWVSRQGAWEMQAGVLHAPASGSESSLLNTLWGEDCVLEAEIAGEPGSVASLLLRATPSGLAGYQVSLDFGRHVVGFYRRFPDRPLATIQERSVTLEPGRVYRLKAVALGKFFDVYVDDALLLVHDERTYADGCFGVHARGAAAFRRVRAAVDEGPPRALPAWSQRTRPRHLFPQG